MSLLWPLFKPGYFTFHDDVQIIRLHQMHECIKDFQIPCRWVPNLGGEYGYPLFNYYGPFPYYFGELIYLLSGSLIISTKTMFAASFIGAFIFMYLLGKKIWGAWGGCLSAVFYSLAPYHAVDLYVRGAMGEMWGLMLYPAILWVLIRLKESISKTNILLLGLFLAILLSSHNISALMFVPVFLACVIYCIVLWPGEKWRKYLLSLLFSVILGLLLSAFYWLPMYAEKNLVHVETTTYGYFSYTEHFKGLRKLFIERNWGWGASVREIPGGERDSMSFQIGWIHIFAWFMSFPLMIYLYKKNKSLFVLLAVTNILILLYIFLIHPRSLFIWQIFDSYMRYIQFPWRFMGMVIFLVSLSTGSIMLSAGYLPTKIIKGINYQKTSVSILLIAVVVFNFNYFKPEKFIDTDDIRILSSVNWDKMIKRSIFDFLPIYAKAPPAELATERYTLLSGVAKVTNFRQGTNWINFDVEADGKTTIQLSQYYFPNWEFMDNGQPLLVEYNNFLGLIRIVLNPGTHTISAYLYNTPIRTAANALTAVGILICLYFSLPIKLINRLSLPIKKPHNRMSRSR